MPAANSHDAVAGCALGSNPLIASSAAWNLTLLGGMAEVTYTTSVIRPDVGYSIQKAAAPVGSDWFALPITIVSGPGQNHTFSAQDSNLEDTGFYRLAIMLFNP